MKKTFCVFLSLIILLCICSCNKAEKMQAVADLAYNRSGDANLLYITENGQYTPFLVLTDDYHGNTLLIRKDVLSTHRRINDYSSYYADSEIDLYLNNEYLKSLTTLDEHIIPSNIEITCDNALGISGLDTESIDRRVFLLSCNEVGIKDSVNIAPEGQVLEYFKSKDNRKAYFSGEPSSWWLRTPNSYYLSCTYVIGDNNKLGFTNAYDKNGIRPAFCVEGNLPIELRSNIIEGKNVYTFSFEN